MEFNIWEVIPIMTLQNWPTQGLVISLAIYSCHTQEARQSGSCYQNSRYQDHTTLATTQ